MQKPLAAIQIFFNYLLVDRPCGIVSSERVNFMKGIHMMNKKIMIIGLMSLSAGFVCSMYAADINTDSGLNEDVGNLVRLQKEVDLRKSLEATDADAKNTNDTNRKDIKGICMSMGRYQGAKLGQKLSDKDRTTVFNICSQVPGFETAHPKAHGSIKPPLKGDAFEILGFSAPYTKYTEKDFTAQYKLRKEQEKNSPARLKQIEAAYVTLKDPTKRAALLEEEVEFTNE